MSSLGFDRERTVSCISFFENVQGKRGDVILPVIIISKSQNHDLAALEGL